MLASVLISKRAAQMNIVIIRAFVRMREFVASHKDLVTRVGQLESTQQQHASVITILADEIDDLKRLPPTSPKHRIGFAQA
jgi:hypothetical protein